MSMPVDERSATSWRRDRRGDPRQSLTRVSKKSAALDVFLMDLSGVQAIVSLDSRRLKVIRDATEA